MWLATLAYLLLATESPTALPAVIVKPRLVVSKARRELKLYSGDRVVKTYRVGLGSNPVPPKLRAGDRATPEGSYVVCIKNPRSQYLLSLGINYPNAFDGARALTSGLITPEQNRRIKRAASLHACPPWNTRLGGEIFIHGHGSASDWTWGCVALDDPDIQELYPRIPVGTPVLIQR